MAKATNQNETATSQEMPLVCPSALSSRPKGQCQSWRKKRSVHLLAVMIVFGATGITGCKGLWLDTQEYWKDTLERPDPIEVVRATKRGDRRAQYLKLIREPVRNGGTQAEQDEAFHLLFESATKDPASICRLAAIKTLGTFEDPRAVEALEAAYNNANTFEEQRIQAMIQQQCLEALGRTGNPNAMIRLKQIARARATQKSFSDHRQATYQRLAAIRALTKFGNHPEVVETLVHVMKNENDIAVKNRCHASLQEVTGLRGPTSATEWEQRLLGGGITNNAPAGPGQRLPQRNGIAVAENPESPGPFRSMIRKVTTGFQN